MGDLCFWYDTFFCLGGICQQKQGNGKDPGMIKKIFCPMTTVVDAIGWDKWKDILLALGFGCFYTACCFNPERYIAIRDVRTDYERVKLPPFEIGYEKV